MDSRKTLLTVALLAILSAVGAAAAPGDILKRIDLGACGSVPDGLAFDGKVLYYTLRFHTNPEIFRVDAATSAALPTIIVKEGGNPFPGGFVGLDWDSNRGRIWAGRAKYAYAVDPATGEIEQDVSTSVNLTIEAIVYDPWLDHVLEIEEGKTRVEAWCPGPIWYTVPCGSIPVLSSEQGLTFDGVDYWHVTPAKFPPDQTKEGYLYPTDSVDQPDYTRAIDLVGKNYNDLAWDCVTFPVGVVWVASNSVCELLAVEVASRATSCLNVPERRILRLILLDTEVAARGSRLPLVQSTSERIFRAPKPLGRWEETQPVQDDPLRPLAFYRIVGPADADQGNILRITKHPNGRGLYLSE